MAYISSQAMFERTMELMASDSDLLKVTPPSPVIHYDFGDPMLLWGSVKRNEFIIDEASLPF